MDKKIGADNDWINSLLTQRDLLQPEEYKSLDVRHCWAQIEECQLEERIQKIVADVNEAAGYQVLDLLHFLPPQTTILSVKFSKEDTEYAFKIEARENGATVVFYSISKVSGLWERCFPNSMRLRKRSIIFEQDLHPAEILTEDLQKWFAYLLSGFDKKFEPKPAKRLSENEYSRLNAALRKTSP
jgi:hypothetical protein